MLLLITRETAHLLDSFATRRFHLSLDRWTFGSPISNSNQRYVYQEINCGEIGRRRGIEDNANNVKQTFVRWERAAANCERKEEWKRVFSVLFLSLDSESWIPALSNCRAVSQTNWNLLYSLVNLGKSKLFEICWKVVAGASSWGGNDKIEIRMITYFNETSIHGKSRTMTQKNRNKDRESFQKFDCRCGAVRIIKGKRVYI